MRASACRGANLQPGDLVFFGSPIHHVGIYVGGGMMIHAPHTGDVVSIDPLHRQLLRGLQALVRERTSERRPRARSTSAAMLVRL